VEQAIEPDVDDRIPARLPEDAESEPATLRRRAILRRLRIGGPRERHAPLDLAQLRGTSSFGRH
jgi:hypothetical protein